MENEGEEMGPFDDRACLHEIRISRAILGAYHQKLDGRLRSDVVVVGAGPSGLVAAADLAERGLTSM
jgi:ribulose 1,5-bisphosphate synthetase/thiazole synthase